MTPADKLNRVRAMLADDGETWDLSHKDKAALRHVLGVIDSMADELADYTGKPIPSVITQHSERVAKGEDA